MEDTDTTARYNSNVPLQASSTVPSTVSTQVTSSNDNNNETYEMLDMDTHEQSNEYEQLQTNEAYQRTSDVYRGQDKQEREDCNHVKVTVNALKKILITTVLANTLMLLSNHCSCNFPVCVHLLSVDICRSH